MSSQLITTWTEHDDAVCHLLAIAAHKLRIFDHDLSKLKLEQADRASALRQFLTGNPKKTIQIAVKNAEVIERNSPRLMSLLASFSHQMKIIQCPPHLISLSDALLLADERHAVVRFHKDQARARAILDEPGECAAYEKRLDEIIAEGGTPISSTTLGL